MQQLIYFFQKYKYFLFFLLLEFIAFALIINNNSFHKSKFVSSTNGITGGLLNTSSEISDYFNLETQNKALAEENIRLKNLLEQVHVSSDSLLETTVIDSVKYNQHFTNINAKITANQYSSSNNFLTINRGLKHGITTEMAVINGKGIIGITENVGNGHSRIQSILNRHSKINARFKNNNYFGTLEWDGKNYNIVQLKDIPRQAISKIGDTIITGGMSTIFPEGILIGTIINIPEKHTASNTLDIQLFNDMSNLNQVYVVKNLYKKELQNLSNE